MMSGYGLPTRVARPPRRFDAYFRCYPIAVLDRRELNWGGKIIMPPSALEKLTRLEIAYPMLFELINGRQQKVTHAGVLEFIAEEGRVYLPYWASRSPPFSRGRTDQLVVDDANPLFGAR
jgi:ubiquitin fusion degradation protein 1